MHMHGARRVRGMARAQGQARGGRGAGRESNRRSSPKPGEAEGEGLREGGDSQEICAVNKVRPKGHQTSVKVTTGKGRR